MEEKIKIVDEIVKRHPSAGVDKGWSWYVGGMRDTGDWYYRKMLDVPIDELTSFLKLLIEEENRPPIQYTEQELADMKTFNQLPNGAIVSEYSRKQFENFSKDQERKMLGL